MKIPQWNAQNGMEEFSEIELLYRIEAQPKFGRYKWPYVSAAQFQNHFPDILTKFKAKLIKI